MKNSENLYIISEKIFQSSTIDEFRENAFKEDINNFFTIFGSNLDLDGEV